MIQTVPINREKKITAYSNAEEAWIYLQQKAQSSDPLPDILILDLELPGEHGLQFLEKLKNDPILHAIPIVVNSSSEKKEAMLKTYKNGALLFMKKSDGPKIFRDVIGQLILMGLLKR